MRKILLTSNLYKPNIGGIENSLYYMAKGYLSIGCEVHIVASDINNFSNESLLSFEEVEGIKIYRYEASGFLNRIKNGINLYRKLSKDNVYSKVIARSHIPILMLFIAGFRDINYIVPGVSFIQNSPRGSRFSCNNLNRLFPEFFHHFLQIFAIRLSSKVFVFSENMLKQVRKHLYYSGEVQITKPGVDTKVFNCLINEEIVNVRRILGYTEKDVVLLGVGRFVSVKGFFYLIESLIYLPEKYKLLLVGDGSERELYNEMIVKLELENRVNIIGPVNETSIYYGVSDVFVLSSVHETLGQTVLEALVSGLPVVAFNNKINKVLTATDEITSSENCILANELSAKSLSKAIIKTSDRLESGFYSRSLISSIAQKKYCWLNIINEL